MTFFSLVCMCAYGSNVNASELIMAHLFCTYANEIRKNQISNGRKWWATAVSAPGCYTRSPRAFLAFNIIISSHIAPLAAQIMWITIAAIHSDVCCTLKSKNIVCTRSKSKRMKTMSIGHSFLQSKTNKYRIRPNYICIGQILLWYYFYCRRRCCSTMDKLRVKKNQSWDLYRSELFFSSFRWGHRFWLTSIYTDILFICWLFHLT